VFTKKEKTILLLLVLIHFCLIVDFMILMPLGPMFMRVFNVGASAFGLLVAAFTLFAGLSGLGGAFFIDRYDRKVFLVRVLVGFMISNLVCGFATNFEYLVVARAVTGFFAGVCGSLLITIVSDTIQIERRGTALGILMSAFALASILGVPLALFLSNKVGWQSPFFMLALFSVAMIVGVKRWMPEMTEHLIVKNEAHQRPQMFLRVVLQNKEYWGGIAFMAVLILGHFTINPFLFTSIVNNGGLPESQLPMVYLAAGVASLLSAIGFGKLTDKLGRTRTFRWALLASLLPIYLVTNVFSNSVVLVVLLVSLFFVLMGGRLTPAMTLITSVARPEDRGRYLSCIVSVQHLATAGASLLAGAILVKGEDGKLLNLPSVGLTAMAFSAVAFILSVRIYRNSIDSHCNH
jgi:DHA1 family inner membrane transport protein